MYLSQRLFWFLTLSLKLIVQLFVEISALAPCWSQDSDMFTNSIVKRHNDGQDWTKHLLGQGCPDSHRVSFCSGVWLYVLYSPPHQMFAFHPDSDPLVFNAHSIFTSLTAHTRRMHEVEISSRCYVVIRQAYLNRSTFSRALDFPCACCIDKMVLFDIPDTMN